MHYLKVFFIDFRAGFQISLRRECAQHLWRTLSGKMVDCSVLSVQNLFSRTVRAQILCRFFCSNGGRCQCGATRDSHRSVALGDYFGTAIVSHWDSTQHSSEQPTDAYGELEFAGSGKRHSYVSFSSSEPG